jgi:hypothetical protein
MLSQLGIKLFKITKTTLSREKVQTKRYQQQIQIKHPERKSKVQEMIPLKFRRINLLLKTHILYHH